MIGKEKSSKLTRIGIFYDGNYFWHVSTFYYQYHERKSRLSVSGLHTFIKEKIAELEDTTPELCKITDAHYFRGRLSATEAAKASGDVLFYERLFDDVLNSEGVTMHHLPLSRTGKGKKKEKGVDVLFALEAYERALHLNFDVVVLIAADGDYIPLVRKLHALGTRVMILGWDLEHESEKKEPTTTYTSNDLLEEATYPVRMNELIDSRASRMNHLINGLFVHKGIIEDRREIKGRPYQAPRVQPRPLDASQQEQVRPTEHESEDEKDNDLNQLAQAPEPELTLTVQESLPTPELKVVGRIDLPHPKSTLQPGEELPEGLVQGQINSIKQGFGFINVGLKENAFFHYKSLNGINFSDLYVGDWVEMHLSRNEKGNLVASDVALLLAEEPAPEE